MGAFGSKPSAEAFTLAAPTGPVVVCLDASASKAEGADMLQWARDSGLLQAGSEVHLLSVVDDAGGSATTTYVRYTTSFLDGLVREAGLYGLVVTAVAPACLSTSASVGSAICEYAIAHGAASVLLGSRNLTTMKRMALSLAGLGSVGAWVAAHAPDTTTVAIHKTQTPPHVPLLQRMAAHPLFVPAGSISEVDQFVLADLVAMMSME